MVTQNGLIIDGFSRQTKKNNVMVNTWLDAIPCWYSDIYEKEIKLPDDNIAGVDTVKVYFRLVIQLQRQNPDVNQSIIKISLQSRTDTKDKNDNYLTLSFSGKQNSLISKFTFNYNNTGDSISYDTLNGLWFTTRINENWQSIGNTGYLPDNLKNQANKDISIVHTVDGKLGGLHLKHEFLDFIEGESKIYFNIDTWENRWRPVMENAYIEDNLIFDYYINDFEFIRYMPQKSQLPVKASDNQIKAGFGIKLPKMKVYDTYFEVRHYATVDIANQFNSVIKDSKNTDNPITQSYQTVFQEVQLDKDGTFNFFYNLIYLYATLNAQRTAKTNRNRYLFAKGRIIEALFTEPEDVLDAKIKIETRIYTKRFKYSTYVEVKDENDTVTKEYADKVTAESEEFLQSLGYSNADAVYYVWKAPKIKAKLNYNKNVSIDGEKVSGKSTISFDTEDSLNFSDLDDIFKEGTTLEAEIVDKNGNVKAKIATDISPSESGEIEIDDDIADKLKTGEYQLNSKWVNDNFELPVSNSISSDSFLNDKTNNNNTNVYLKPLKITGKLLIEDSNSTVTNVTNDNSKLIQNKSRMKVTIPSSFINIPEGNGVTAISLSLNENIKSISYSATNAMYAIFEPNTLNASGINTLNLTIKDKEGITTTYTQNFNVELYYEPILSISINYIDVAQNRLELKLQAVIASINDKNKLSSLKYRMKESSSNNWTSYTADNLANGYQNQNTKKVYISVPFDINTSKSFLDYTFDFEVVAKDLMGVEKTTLINNQGLGQPLIFFDESLNSVGLGVFPSKTNTTTVRNITFDNSEAKIEVKNGQININQSIIINNVDILAKLTELESKLN